MEVLTFLFVILILAPILVYQCLRIFFNMSIDYTGEQWLLWYDKRTKENKIERDYIELTQPKQ